MTSVHIVASSYRIRPPHSANIDNLLTRQGSILLAEPTVMTSGTLQRTEKSIAIHSRAGYLSASWIDSFYNRIAIIPTTQSLGAISSEQTVTVKVWNAYLSAQTLLSMAISGDEGIALSGPVTPREFNRLAIHEWQLTISMDGPSAINCTVTWQFAGMDPVTFTLTGSRTVSWLLAPDWSDGITENLEWKTDVHRSQTGAAQRVARRLSPRRTFEFKIIADAAARRRFEQQLFNYGSRSWALPIYPDQARLPAVLPAGSDTVPLATAGRDFVAGGMALICASTAVTAARETVEIAGVEAEALTLSRVTQNDWPASTLVYPLRSAVITDQPRLMRKNDGVITAQMRFLITEHNAHSDEHGLTLHRGFPVIEPGSDWSEDLTAEYSRLLAELDNDIGIPYRLDTAERPFIVQSHAWLAVGRERQRQLRCLLYWLRGRQRPVWVGSQATDMIAVADIANQTLDIESIGFTDSGGALPGRQDIRIETTTGVYYTRITASAILDDDTERLVIDAALNISRTQILKISWLTLCHLSSDSAAWEHKTDADGVAALSLTFEGVRDELE
ncbi:hypothetical protein BIY29_10230 [Brenneria alni]|uniref:Uncharacterized protein n=1 Tax=Brenneria alni TaxID=71656 RepID=A0A421DNH1_9GAMM|nr:hypothetical protein [Brenneria alni]RLM23669.1 hypothetical protein BIY29_10230 [Brenneria alni]